MSSLKDRRSSKIDEPAAIKPAALPAPRASLPEVTIGRVVGFTGAAPLVDYPDNPAKAPLPALATAPVSPEVAGRAVALVFIEGDPLRPLMLGMIRVEAPVVLAGGSDTQRAERGTAVLDGERVVLAAQTEIELKCGKASITLTRAGKIIIRGAYVVSRSSGANRIQGGSVEIN